MLTVKDELAGRHAKCPGCQQVMAIPQALFVPPPLPLPVAPRPAPVAFHPAAAKPAESAPGSRAARCFLHVAWNRVRFGTELYRCITRYVDSEQLGFKVVECENEETLPKQLDRDDILLSVKIVRCNFGSRAVRYWLTFIALFGPGSSQLAVDVKLQDGRGGNRRLSFKARQAVGIFGGSDEGLMAQNVKILCKRIAVGMARHVTGTWFLNRNAYDCAVASLVLGLLSVLLPCAGFVFGSIGLVVGAISLTTITKRNLPRRRGMAISGLCLSAAGTILGVAFLIYSMSS